MASSDDESAEGCAALVGLFLVTPPKILAATWVVSQLWAWFMVPLHVPAINRWHTLGLLLLAECLTYHGGSKDTPKDPWSDLWYRTLTGFAQLLVAYLLGWLAHANMS